MKKKTKQRNTEIPLATSTESHIPKHFPSSLFNIRSLCYQYFTETNQFYCCQYIINIGRYSTVNPGYNYNYNQGTPNRHSVNFDDRYVPYAQ